MRRTCVCVVSAKLAEIMVCGLHCPKPRYLKIRKLPVCLSNNTLPLAKINVNGIEQ